MAWSGNFTSEPETVYWTYTRRTKVTGYSIYFDSKSDGYNYDDYSPNAGVAVGIDITSPGVGSTLIYHSGTLSTELTKVVSTNSRESAVACYYHKQILPSISLSFSSSGPSINIEKYTGTYDKSVDSAVAFWSMN